MAKMTLKRLQRIEMPMLCRRRNGKRYLRFYPIYSREKHPVQVNKVIRQGALLRQLWLQARRQNATGCA